MKNENETVIKIAEGREKERPILYSTPMVHAILKNIKTKTRRIVKGVPLEWLAPDMFTTEFVASPENDLCPYGKVGDIMWVRETYTILEPEHCEGSMQNRFFFKAGQESNEEWRLECIEKGYTHYKWKPSIFMRRDACRIFLRIDGLRIERLQDITEEEALQEGIHFDEDSGYYFAGDVAMGQTARDCFRELWYKINGVKSWDDNPFVWVISFYRTVAGGGNFNNSIQDDQ